MLQFRNELTVSKFFGKIQLRLAYTNAKTASDTNAQQVLKNGFHVSNKAVTLYAAESNPLILRTAEKKEIPLVLQSWEEKDKTSFILFFSENVSLLFDGDSEQLNVNARIPAKALSVSIPYKTTETYSVTDISQSRALIKSKSETEILHAQIITNEYIKVSPSSPFIRLSRYEEVSAFSFASVAGFDKAQDENLKALVRQSRNAVFENFSATSPENLNERLVCAYLAECAERGTYHGGLGSVSASFIDGTKRTYFSSPYFNTLVKMNQTLVMERENIFYRIQYSLEKKNLDVFELDQLPFVLLQCSPEETAALLSLPASLAEFSPSAAQAAGILDVYAALNKVHPVSTEALSPVLQHCAAVLESSCTLSDSGLLYLEDKGSRANAVLTAKAAKALQNYGKTVSDKNIEAGGTLLLSSVLENLSSADSRLLADLYPYIAEDNAYYPHIDVIGFENGRPVWAWTIASNIDYSKEKDGTIVLHTSFPAEETHYMILNGIEPFSSIEIYGLLYRTDPRFESYNSSGYVYNAGTKTLFLKYRHKSAVETIRLFYKTQPPADEKRTEEDKAETEISEEMTQSS